MNYTPIKSIVNEPEIQKIKPSHYKTITNRQLFKIKTGKIKKKPIFVLTAQQKLISIY